MPERKSSRDVRRAGDRLRALSGNPAAQAEFAAELIVDVRDPIVLDAALKALEAAPRDGAREALVALYQELAANPPKRDAGGFTRAGILRALRPVATVEDTPLYERASRTYEPTYQDKRGPTGVRAAGLAGLATLDPAAATIRAAQLLWDWEYASHEDAEPVATAVQVLGLLGQQAALITFLLEAPPFLAEACAQAYRELAGLPGAMLRDLVTTAFRADPDPNRPPPVIPLARDDLALLGLVDLVVDHKEDEELLPVLKLLAGSSISLDLYQYLVSAVVARRRPPLMGALLEHAATEMQRERLQMLAESLELVPGPEAAAARDEILRRLAAREPRMTEPLPSEEPAG